eukprot:1659716-Rhodomonas_salina.3
MRQTPYPGNAHAWVMCTTQSRPVGKRRKNAARAHKVEPYRAHGTCTVSYTHLRAHETEADL